MLETISVPKRAARFNEKSSDSFEYEELLDVREIPGPSGGTTLVEILIKWPILTVREGQPDRTWEPLSSFVG